MRPRRTLLLLMLCAASMRGEEAEPTQPGSVLFGQRQFIEYQAGDLPLVLAAPHGGREVPSDVPDRTQGVVSMDANTQELARAIADEVRSRTGHPMHLILCRLHRSKLDPNRDLQEAAQGNEVAANAWREHHSFIEKACDAAVRRFGVAFLIDLHGHGHPDPRIELGYLLSAQDLAADDATLNAPATIQSSSLQWITKRSSLSHAALLRGPESLGALLENEGFPATPSPLKPVPGEPFFRGGYTIQRHCDARRNITGLQIETSRPRLRDTPANRQRFATALVDALAHYLPAHLGWNLDGTKIGSRSIPETPARPEPAAAIESR